MITSVLVLRNSIGKSSVVVTLVLVIQGRCHIWSFKKDPKILRCSFWSRGNPIRLLCGALFCATD